MVGSGTAGVSGGWTAGTPNDDLVSDGYYGSTGVTTTLGGLTSGQLYDLIVYHADEYVAQTVTVNGIPPVNYTGTFANSYADAFEGLVGSDFWYFQNLTPNGSNQLVISSLGPTSGFVTITGFQIVEVPEPNSLAILLFGGAFCWLFKSRQRN